MSSIFSPLVWVLFAIGAIALFIPGLASQPYFFDGYTTLLKLYLLGMSAFFLLKHAFFKLDDQVDTIRLSQRSELQSNFIGHGIMLVAIYVLFVSLHGSLKSFNIILIALVSIYYIAQVVLNSQPSIHISEKAFAYDDYFVARWDWKNINRIQLNDKRMRLIGANRDFELDFSLIDEIDVEDMSNEIASSVLDGQLSRAKSSKDLIRLMQNYAQLHNIQLEEATPNKNL